MADGAVAAISTPQVLRYGEATDLERTQHKDEEEDNTPTRDDGDGDNTGGLKRGRSKYRPIFHFFTVPPTICRGEDYERICVLSISE
jgi:hypothetical protein